MNIDRTPLLVVREFYGLAVAAVVAGIKAPRKRGEYCGAVVFGFGVLLVNEPALCAEICNVRCLRTVFARCEYDAVGVAGDSRLEVILTEAVVADIGHCNTGPLGKRCAV